MKPLRVFIINYFSPNKGDTAVFLGTLLALRRYLPRAQFIVSATHPELVDKRHDIKRVIPHFLEDKFSSPFLIWLLKSFVRFLKYIVFILLYKARMNVNFIFNAEERIRLREYISADIVIAQGGGYIHDCGGIFGFFVPHLYGHLFGIFFATLLGKPTILYAHSIGPFKNRFNTFLASFILNRVTLITLREPESMKYIKPLKIKKRVYVTADPAFLLPFEKQEVIERILLTEGINMIQRPLIGITVYKWFWQTSDPRSLKRRYKSVIALLTDYLVEALKAQVVFIPMEHLMPGIDDRPFIFEIVEKVRNKSNVKVITNDYTPEVIKGIIGNMDLVISTRAHATIFAAAMTVPILTIAYQPKAIGFMKMLNLNKYTCYIENLSLNELISKTNDIWCNREEIRKKLQFQVNFLRKRTLYNAELVLRELERCGKVY